MAIMPEAASALYLEQFSDEAVRDAIARVSKRVLLLHSIHVAVKHEDS